MAENEVLSNRAVTLNDDDRFVLWCLLIENGNST
jgi:hypothetical protein